MKSVTYWYQFFTAREELVPILHDVKFTKCEIYGSTKHNPQPIYLMLKFKHLFNKNLVFDLIFRMQFSARQQQNVCSICV